MKRGHELTDPKEFFAAVEETREEWEARTVVTENGETIAELRKAFDAFADPNDWKACSAALVKTKALGLVFRAVEFFHGARPVVVGRVDPETGTALVYSDGYCC